MEIFKNILRLDKQSSQGDLQAWNLGQKYIIIASFHSKTFDLRWDFDINDNVG